MLWLLLLICACTSAACDVHESMHGQAPNSCQALNALCSPLATLNLQAVQSHTLKEYTACIKAFLGWNFMSPAIMSVEQLSLCLYLQPKIVARFVGFLLARGCGAVYIVQHVTVARRVVEYLNATATGLLPSELQALASHANNMAGWLLAVRTQLVDAAPRARDKVSAELLPDSLQPA